MDEREARGYLNYLLTMSLRREEAFGPLALTFLRENDLSHLGLLAEEQFNLIMATVQAFSPEPKRYSQKLELLKKARSLLARTNYNNADLGRRLDYDIRKTEAELEIYNDAMRPGRRAAANGTQALIVQTDAPEYFLDVAQRRAAAYYQEKYHLSSQAKAGQHFAGSARRFEPDNESVHREHPGACAPFMTSRVNAFHMMLPFDLQVTRRAEEPLDGGVRIFYSKEGYSFPLAYEMDKLCSYYDGEMLDISLDDPHLLFVSVSRVKEREFVFNPGGGEAKAPPEYEYPRLVLERIVSLGTFLQIPCNFKIWFDAAAVSILIQGAPDLHEYGVQGGSGLLTRTYSSDKVGAYVESFKEPWQEGLSFNFINLHLQLQPDKARAFIPCNTPIFTMYPVLSKQNYRLENAAKQAGGRRAH